jgi:hypothetical protein
MSTMLPVDAHSFISMISVIAKMSMIKTAIKYRMHNGAVSHLSRQGESNGSKVALHLGIAYLAAYTRAQNELLW